MEDEENDGESEEESDEDNAWWNYKYGRLEENLEFDESLWDTEPDEA